MKTFAFTAALASGALLLAGASVPAFAASARSDAFVANVRPNVDFLDNSSRLALDTSKSPRVRAFAHDEAMEQTITGNQLVAWDETNTRRGEAVALGTPLGGPLASLGAIVTAPLDVASGVTSGVANSVDNGLGGIVAAPLGVATNVTNGVTGGIGGLLTGRSVAVTNPQAPLDGGTLLPSDQRDMTRLRSMSGREFDALYVSTQRDSLRQLATLYRDYIAKGDDPSLRAIAQRELPRVTHRLAELRRL